MPGGGIQSRFYHQKTNQVSRAIRNRCVYVTSNDIIKEIKERENSVLTFQKINRKEYGRLSRSKKVVYKRSEP